MEAIKGPSWPWMNVVIYIEEDAGFILPRIQSGAMGSGDGCGFLPFSRQRRIWFRCEPLHGGIFVSHPALSSGISKGKGKSEGRQAPVVGTVFDAHAEIVACAILRR